jgi:hypothetical protein
MSSFWVDACKDALSRPLQSRLDALNASSGVTVTCAAAAAACFVDAVLTFERFGVAVCFCCRVFQVCSDPLSSRLLLLA